MIIMTVEISVYKAVATMVIMIMYKNVCKISD